MARPTLTVTVVSGDPSPNPNLPERNRYQTMPVELIVAILIAAFFAVLAGFLFWRQAELVSTGNELREQVTGLQRDNRKLQGQLETKTQKYSKKAQEVSKRQSKEKGRKQRLAQQQNELQTLRSELKRSEEKAKEVSTELNRLRMSREEMRQELAKANETLDELQSQKKPRPATATATDAAATESEPESQPAPEPVADEQSEARRASIGRLERELDKANKDYERLSKSMERMRKGVLEREAELRKLRRKNEHNRRAYIITQLQLDLAQDELYTLKHGEPPKYKMADKAAKRQALRPSAENIRPEPGAEPIDLIGVGEDDEPEAFDDDVVGAAEAASDDESAKAKTTRLRKAPADGEEAADEGAEPAEAPSAVANDL